MALREKQAENRTAVIEQESILYRFHLCLEPGQWYSGMSEIDFALNCIPQDLFLDCKAKEINQLLINNHKVENILAKDGFLALSSEFLVQGANHVMVQYRTKYDNDGNGCVSFIDVDGKQYLYTQFEAYHANRVFALFDQPDLKATMELSVISPLQWKRVMSNEYAVVDEQFEKGKYLTSASTTYKGHLQAFSEGKNGRMSIFPKTKMLPTYLYCFVAGPYERLELQETYKGIPMSIFCIESLFKYMKEMAPFIFQVTIECMKFFEEFFGYPFPFNKYDQVFAHEYKAGAMENAGIVTFNDIYIFKEKVSQEKMQDLANTISHELSHHWFGDLVTMKWWDDLWLNESFAEFISHFCLEKVKNKLKTVDIESSMASFLARKAWGYHEDQYITTHPIRGEVPNTSVADSIFDGITYAKGAATMKQLLLLMGEENFSAALKEYFHKYAFKNATLSDFMAEMQKHFPFKEFSLEEWKQYWLQKASLNQLEPVWNIEAHGEKEQLKIIQTPFSENYNFLRPHKIRIALFKENCSYDVIEALVQPQKQTIVTYNGSNQYKAILLNFEDHTFAKVIIDHHSQQFFTKYIVKIDDVLTRTLIWRSYFDMVKDGILPSTKYMQVFMNNIFDEKSDSIFERHFSYLYTAINIYTPRKYREELNQQAFDFLLSLVPKIPQDQENRLVIVRSKIAQYATSEKSKQILLQWRKGQFEPLKDHKITVVQQWTAVVKAFTLPNLSLEEKEALFEDQKKIDNSDTAKLKRALCDSLKANREQFQQIYLSFRDPKNEQSITLKREIAAGWNHSFHLEWLKEYKQRYLQDIMELHTVLESQHFQLFIEQLEPIDDNLEETIEGLSKIHFEGEKYDKNSRDILKMIDDFKRRVRAYSVFEQNSQ